MLETKTDLQDKTREALQDLIEINIDSVKGLREAAQEIDHNAIAQLFRQIASDRQRSIDELKGYVRLNREEPEDDGSLAGSIHRAWLDFRAAISGGDPKAVLSEAERGEDAIKGKYEELLRETAGSAMNDVLMRQYAHVKHQHDSIRDLRDSFAD